MTGYIYAIQVRDRVKLGFSTNPERRLNKIASDSAYPCQLLAFWEGTLADEAALHGRFAHVRAYREWFEGSPDLLAFIETKPAYVAPEASPNSDDISTDTAIYRARLAAGSVANLSTIIGVTSRQTITYQKQPQKLPALGAVKINKALGIPLHELRPDIFPAPSKPKAKSKAA